MATTINKVSSYANWRKIGTTIFGGGGGGGTVDLSNYYTKINLQTSGGAEISFGNITEAYHNYLLGLQGGLIVGDSDNPDDSSGVLMDDEYFHLSGSDYDNLMGITFQDSVDKDSDNIVTLVGDEDSPGNDQYYGTDSGGNKGWWGLPGGDVHVFGTPLIDQLAIWTNADTIKGMAGLTYDGSTLNITGDVTATDTMTAANFCLSSDERIKQNIKNIVPEPTGISYKQFELKSQPEQVRYGVIAQELVKTHPELVRTGVDGMMTVSYIDLLVLEIVDLKARIKELEKLLEYE